jgi:hypothetical protein
MNTPRVFILSPTFSTSLRVLSPRTRLRVNRRVKGLLPSRTVPSLREVGVMTIELPPLRSHRTVLRWS